MNFSFIQGLYYLLLCLSPGLTGGLKLSYSLCCARRSRKGVVIRVSIKQKNALVRAARCSGIIVMFLLFVAACCDSAAARRAGKSVKVVKEAQGREGPGSYYRLVTLIPEGTTLQVVEKKRSWYKVKYNEQEIWISENSISVEKEPKKKDIFDSLTSFDQVSAAASPATLTAAIKGFWTRYSSPFARGSTGKTYELPVEGYDIPAASYETFVRNRSRTVSREDLFKKYKLKSRDKKHKVPYKQEHSIGYTCASAVADAPLVENDTLIRYIHSVGWYIAEGTERYDVHFNYYILNTDRINAVSCPGGYIVLTQGLLELLHDESELAALLAHEMAHVIAGHGMIEVMEDKTRIRADSAFDALSRETQGSTELENELIAITNRAVSIAQSPKLDKYEFEADELALRYMARSGYDVNGHVRLLNTLMAEHDKNTDIFDLNYRNHPDFTERLKRTENEMRDYRRYKGFTFTENFKKNMVF